MSNIGVLYAYAFVVFLTGINGVLNTRDSTAVGLLLIGVASGFIALGLLSP